MISRITNLEGGGGGGGQLEDDSTTSNDFDFYKTEREMGEDVEEEVKLTKRKLQSNDGI
jgi:hypothetical protein